MARALPAGGPSGSSSRTRKITNKTRLKVVRGGSLDFDDFELEEAVVNTTQGVDDADAKETHLVAALSSLSSFIPTPDSTGVVSPDEYDALYATRTWVDDHQPNVYSLDTDQSVENSLQDGFTYYMDERDRSWLDKVNEEARGEGTSTKMHDASGLGIVSEDEFELVMGVFERVTQEKTAYLHHSFDPVVSFPAFGDYEETFAKPLPGIFFHSYAPPLWAPAPLRLVHMARVVYPHWKTRRIDRSGHKIIPCSNYDESDTANESFICFRRREIKAVRKTRASQVSSNDKLLRLHQELIQLEDIARLTYAREAAALENTRQARDLWEKRLSVVDALRRNPSYYNKQDDEILMDKERVIKKPRMDLRVGLRIRTGRDARETPGPLVELIRPKERVQRIQLHIDSQLARMREEDKQWDDQVDLSYQTLPPPYGSRLHKYISPQANSSATSFESERAPRASRTVRMRYGRGGRMHVDRRFASPQVASFRQLLEHPDGYDSEDDSRARDLMSQWRFDVDDNVLSGPDGLEEKDRTLIDDYSQRYTAATVHLMPQSDILDMNTNTELALTHPDGGPRIGQPIKRMQMPMRPPPPPPQQQFQQLPPNNMPPAKRMQGSIPGGMRIPNNNAGRPIQAMMMGGQHLSAHSSPPHVNGDGPFRQMDQQLRDHSPARPRSQNQGPPPTGNIYPPKQLPPQPQPQSYQYPMESHGQWLPQAQNAGLKAVGARLAPDGSGRPIYNQQGANMNLTLPPSRGMHRARGSGSDPGARLPPPPPPTDGMRTHPSPTRLPVTPNMAQQQHAMISPSRPHMSPSVQQQQAV